MNEQFAVLDLNKDIVLSQSELRKAFQSMRLIESYWGIDMVTTLDQLSQLYDSIFNKFDLDRNSTVDLNEFMTALGSS